MFRKIWRHKSIIFATVTLLTGLAVIIVFQLKPRYTAQTLLMIESRQSMVVDLDAVIEGLPADSETTASEIEVIRSRGLAGKVIDRLGLSRDPEFSSAHRPPSLLEEALDSIGIPVAEWMAALPMARDKEDLSADTRRERDRIRVVDAVLENLTVTSKRSTRVITVQFESESPRTAARVANTLAELYIDEQLEAKFEATRRATVWLNDRVAALRQTVQGSEKAVEEYRRASGLLEGKGGTIASQQVSELSTQVVLARAKRAEAEARLAQLAKLGSSVDGVDSVADVLNSRLIQRLREQEASVARKVAEYSILYGERHPKVINVRAEIGALRERIESEVDKIVKGLRNDASVARAREASLERSLDEVMERMADSNTAEVQLRALEREANANGLLLGTLLTRIKETQMQENLEAQRSDVRIISRADLPQLPSFPKMKPILALSLVGSFCLGLLLIFAIEQMDPGFRSGEQVERETGVPVLGLVPKQSRLSLIRRGRSLADYVVKRPTSALVESMRSLHTGIRLSQEGRWSNRILITSAQPMEGKTTIAVCLARVLAMSGIKVLLIDADLRHPSIHRILGLPKSPGLAELLSGQCQDVRDVMRKDKATGATIITAGQATVDATKLLASEQLNKLLMLGMNYDLLIFDSPPVLAVSDARILASRVDRTVFVVRWAKTRREVATMAMKQIAKSGGELAGVLLSVVDVKKHARYGFGDSGSYHGAAKKYYSG